MKKRLFYILLFISVLYAANLYTRGGGENIFSSSYALKMSKNVSGLIRANKYTQMALELHKKGIILQVI
jgi:hypothetical protein